MVRKFLKFIGFIFCLFILALAIFLLPPHWQTRKIAPELPGKETIQALSNMPDGPVSLSYIITSTQHTPRGTLGHASFIVQWEDGKIFMVDAGMDQSGAKDFAKLMEKVANGGDGVIFGDVAGLLGSSAKRVGGIAFTHLHNDHTQGVTAFCEARKASAEDISVYKTGLQDKFHNFNTKESADIIEKSCLQPGLLSNGIVKSVDGFPGLGMAEIGGHTPGSTLFVIAMDDHIWLLSGDTTNTKIDLLEDNGKGFVYSYLLVPENTAQTRKLRRWLAALDADENISVIVSHDLAALEASGLKPFAP